MTPPARAAALRGDDYQHIIGWYWACQALLDPDIISISIEDVDGGAFDDIVVRRHTDPSCFLQVKSSNTAETIIDANWLTTASTPNGKSPLKHFHATWAAHRYDDPLPRFQLISNRAFDHIDPILRFLDKHSNTVGQRLRPSTPGSKAGKQRKSWAEHLGITVTEMSAFLDQFELHHEGNEASWFRQARDAMRGAGLRIDNDAVTLGRDLVREWVKTGAGARTRDDIRKEVTAADLLARKGTLIFAVHAIDRPAHSLQPVQVLDFVDLYEGETDRERRQLVNPDDWQTTVMPQLAAKVQDLEAFGVRRVHVIGAMRLPMWFATGVRLPDIRGWVVSADQRTDEWRSDVTPSLVEARELHKAELGQGADLAVAVALTHDIAGDVEAYLRSNGTSVGELVVFGPAHGPSQTAVPDAAFAVGWAHAARTAIAIATQRTAARHLHLFFAAPAGAALMLGHHWNMMPPTTVYEHLVPTYAPAMTIR
ncbi:SAVED domain-containing protein [Asanoa sp. NPDC049573]|uniref:SAVED domain-containing protein n=1 Tax=Asanoa sp. NPDC049573 TaxID=3155396 RepID=UPI003443BB4D